jgi:hypothetical protein
LKKLKEIVNQIKASGDTGNADFESLIRSFIFYSPKMPLRLHQEQLLAESKQFELKVPDTYFTSSSLTINCFSWGTGKTKILLTHGWASKAADFHELITELIKIEDTEVIAFDAPGNGSSISEYSNLILYVESVKSITKNYAKPDFIIGHSLGGMANAIAVQDLAIQPKLLISIAPLIRLKENFEQSLQSIEISESVQDTFFENFSKEFPVDVSYFNLTELYVSDENITHFLAYDPEDHISPYSFLQEFLKKNAQIASKAYNDVGHYKILKSADLIQDISEQIKSKI